MLVYAELDFAELSFAQGMQELVVAKADLALSRHIILGSVERDVDWRRGSCTTSRDGHDLMGSAIPVV